MPVKLTIIVFAVIFTISGCVHYHPAKPRASTVVVKTAKVLEAEHNQRQIVLLYQQPLARRACWKHAQHWHCKS